MNRDAGQVDFRETCLRERRRERRRMKMRGSVESDLTARVYSSCLLRGESRSSSGRDLPVIRILMDAPRRGDKKGGRGIRNRVNYACKYRNFEMVELFEFSFR